MAKNFQTSGSKKYMTNGSGNANQFAGLVAGLGGNSNDPTRQPQAKTGKDVQGQDWQTRLWQSYQNAARYQTDASNKAYGLARGAADRQATSRGMGRSSYNNQTLSNIDIEKVNAANKIQDDAIAAYQQAFQNQTNIENQMAWEKEKARQEQENWQKQFDLQREQFDWQKQQAAQSGSGGGGGGDGYPGYPGYPGDTGNPVTEQELFGADLNNRTRADSQQNADTSARGANRTTSTTSRSDINAAWERNQQIAQQRTAYQNQINRLGQQLASATSNAERQRINNEINRIKQQMRNL